MIKIKIVATLCFCVLFHTLALAQDNPFKGTLYVVRHAEKDTGNNPALSVAGKKRAGDLYRELKDKKIDLILTSQYRRTAMTADSLRVYNNIETIQYMADGSGASVSQAIAANAGKAKNILIIGHSNTVPLLVKNSGVENYVAADLPDHEYDNLFIVDKTKEKAVLAAKKYGQPSVATGGNTPMKISQ